MSAVPPVKRPTLLTSGHIRVCCEHLYPVGDIDTPGLYLCLLKYELLPIVKTRYIKTDGKLIANLMTARTDCIGKREEK